MRTKKLFLGVFALVVGGLAACSDNLEVLNENNPDLERVYKEPTDIEAVVATLYRTYHQGTQGAAEGLNSQSKAMSFESYGQVANFGMNLRGLIPRVAIDNSRGNQVAGGNNNNWSTISRLMRTASVATQAVDRMLAASATMGDAGRNLRSRSFGFFVNGISLGTLALGYDSIHVVTTKTAAATIPAFVGYAAAMDSALRMLDSAITVMNAAVVATGMTTIPAAWINGGSADMTPAQYIQLVRSYRARLRAGVARTPTERTAVNWTLVLADAQNGIATDHQVLLSSAAGGWSSSLDAGTFQTSASWHQVSLLYIGMADTSGAYQTFANAAGYTNKIGMDVLVLTPDTRWPSGTTRGAQTAASALPLVAGQYISNRDPGGDQPDNSNPSGTSQYDHRRWFAISQNTGNGTYVFMPKVEIDMLAAEADIRVGAGAVALPLVNASRAAHGLPAYAAAGALAPGGTGCVPRLPNGACGTLLEAMKYEKRMETQLTGYMQWFNDSRGWGDLIAGTPLHWPVPYQEMDTRNQAFYPMPSAGTLGVAAVGTYGF
ncbi:MAG: hypothetical protein WD771_02380 [Gemmatimonadaceae bacterium]